MTFHRSSTRATPSGGDRRRPRRPRSRRSRRCPPPSRCAMVWNGTERYGTVWNDYGTVWNGYGAVWNGMERYLCDRAAARRRAGMHRRRVSSGCGWYAISAATRTRTPFRHVTPLRLARRRAEAGAARSARPARSRPILPSFRTRRVGSAGRRPLSALRQSMP